MRSFESIHNIFKIFIFQYGRSLRNFHAEQPHQHAVYFTSVLMSELLWTQEELLDALDGELHRFR